MFALQYCYWYTVCMKMGVWYVVGLGWGVGIALGSEYIGMCLPLVWKGEPHDSRRSKRGACLYPSYVCVYVCMCRY